MADSSLDISQATGKFKRGICLFQKKKEKKKKREKKKKKRGEEALWPTRRPTATHRRCSLVFTFKRHILSLTATFVLFITLQIVPVPTFQFNAPSSSFPISNQFPSLTLVTFTTISINLFDFFQI